MAIHQEVELTPVKSCVQEDSLLPEITVRGVFLGVLLAIIFAAASTFIGLKIAGTIAGSIPAALISMAVLRRFKGNNILENNIVQTIASAGESVASGIIFTIPALILLGFWDSFHYVQTMLITVIGSVLGVMFSIPLRRKMIFKDNLPYPEGLVTGEILKCSDNNTSGPTKVLLKGSVIAALITFLQTGFKIVSDQLCYWTKAGATVFGGSIMLSPMMMASGYILGIRPLIAFTMGGLLTWGVFIPLYVYLNGIPEGPDLATTLAEIQKANFRYMAVGVLIIGGIWSVITLIKPIIKTICTSFSVMRNTRISEFSLNSSVNRDLPLKYLLMTIVGITISIFILFLSVVETSNLLVSGKIFWTIVIFSTILSLTVGFVSTAVAAYLVGIIGTTSFPLSGITIASIIAFSSILLFLLGANIDFNVNVPAILDATALVIIFASIIAVTASVSGINMQSLKAGQIVGGTPWKQQLMLIIGAIAAALVIPFVLQTTFEAYGIGEVLPRPGMDPNQALSAVQATLMATVAKGFFTGELPWKMIGLGAVLGMSGILLDEYLRYKKSRFQFPVMLFALGMYLPLSYITAFLVGGIINCITKYKNQNSTYSDADTGILFASGLIAGEAILGIILTIPFAYYQKTDLFVIDLPWVKPYQTILGLIIYIILGFYLYRQGVKRKNKTTEY